MPLLERFPSACSLTGSAKTQKNHTLFGVCDFFVCTGVWNSGLFPLDGCRWLGGYVVGYAVDSTHFVDYVV